MRRSEGEALGNRVVQFFENQCGHNKVETRRHFMAEGIPRSTINDILARYEERGTVVYNPRSGRPRSKSTPKVVHDIAKLLKSNPNCSVRDGAGKKKVTKSTFQYIKKEILGMKAYRKETVPKYSGDQAARAKSARRQLYRDRLLSSPEKVLVMDDETYVHADPAQVPGLEFYHCTTKSTVSDQYRFKGKTKFPKRYLVWRAIDEHGNVSDPFISQGSMNGDLYLKECLQKRLSPFIKNHHKLENVLFWPDMATCHYRKDVKEWLKVQNIDFIDKMENAPNVPQARPIERFWALCKKAYKARNAQAISLSSFKRIWKKLSTKVAQQSAQAIMKGARKNIRAIGYGGVLAPFK